MSNRQDDALPVVAYLRATKAGEPVWDEDCICQDPVYPACPDGSDADCISMPMVRLSDAQSAIASLQARLDAAEKDAARYQHIRYFGFNWFGEVIRLAQLDREIDAVLAEKTK